MPEFQSILTCKSSCTGKTPTLLHSLASRGTPKMRDPSTAFLPGLGNVQLKEGIPKGEPRSFQMIDCTRKVTCRTTDADHRFILHVQLEIPDPRPAAGNQAGMDLGVRHLAAIADECGNETLHNVAGGCRRRDGDKVDRMKSEQAGHKKGSGAWRKTDRQIRKNFEGYPTASTTKRSGWQGLTSPQVVETPSHRATIERQRGMICVEKIAMPARRLARLRLLPNCPSVPQDGALGRQRGHSWMPLTVFVIGPLSC